MLLEDAPPLDCSTQPTFSPVDMRGAAESACRLMKVLSNPDRLLLLCQLGLGERRVGELETLLDIHQPTLSQQLGVLRDEGLVITRREGKSIHYRIAPGPALAVIQILHQQFCPQSPTTPFNNEELPHDD